MRNIFKLFIFCFLIPSVILGAPQFISIINLRNNILLDLENNVANYHNITIAAIENTSQSKIDVKKFQNQLILDLIQSKHFHYINRDLLPWDLKSIIEDNLRDVDNPNFKGFTPLDAVIFIQIINTSYDFPELRDEDYFTLARIKVVSIKSGEIIYISDIYGYNKNNIINKLGAIPNMEFLSVEDEIGKTIIRYLEQSKQITSNIKTLTVANKVYEDSSWNQAINQIKVSVEKYIANSNQLKILEPLSIPIIENEHMLINKGTIDIEPENNTYQYGTNDGLLFIEIQEIKKDTIVCEFKLHAIYRNVDMESGVVTQFHSQEQYSLPELLRLVGPSYITSIPTGARIFINNEFIGNTPLQYKFTNDITLTFRKNNYLEKTIKIMSNFGRKQNIQVNLDLIPVNLSIITNPDSAEVFFNDSFLGLTPITNLDYSPGPYSIKIKKKDYYAIEERINLIRGNNDLSFSLKYKFGTLWITSSPKSVNVSIRKTTGNLINDIIAAKTLFPSYTKVGDSSTPISSLESGKYRLKLSKIGWENYFEQFSILPQDTIKMLRSLNRKTPLKALRHAIFIPGLGQYYTDKYKIGKYIGLSFLASTALGLVTNNIYSHVSTPYKQKILNVARYSFSTIAISSWIYGMVDSYFFFPYKTTK